MAKELPRTAVLRSYLRSLVSRAGLRHGMAMFAATSLANVLDYGFNVAMGRLLSAGGYGVLVALNAVLQIVSVSMVVGSTVVAHYIAEFAARGQRGRMSAFVQSALRSTVLWGGGAALLVGVLSAPIARLLQIPSKTPVWVAAAALLPMVVKLVTVGTLQGLQKFNALGTTHVIQAALRLAFGVLLVRLGTDAVGALAALPASATGSVLLGLAFLGGIAWKRTGAAHRVRTADLMRYAGATIVGVVSFAALTNVDVLIVKRYYPPAEAGYYSMAVTLGKIIVFLPAAFAQVLFPKSAQRHVQRRDSSRLVRLSLAATSLPCAALTAAYWVAPGPILRTVFGVASPFQGPVLGLLALAMSGYALVNVWLNYFLSVEQTGFVYALAAALIAQLVLLTLYHDTLTQVAIVLAVTGAGLLVFSEAWFQLQRRDHRERTAREPPYGPDGS